MTFFDPAQSLMIFGRIEIKQELDLLRRELRSDDVERDLHRDIGPSRAAAMIREWLADGVPEALIVERLSRLGPPQSWISITIKDLQKARARDNVPKMETTSPSTDE
jgi:hypothetical protein